VGLQVGIADARVTNLISVGTPVDKYDFGFLQECRKPILFVQGDQDEFGDAERLRVIVDELKEKGHADVQLTVIPGAGHFFDDTLDELKRLVREWIEQRLKPSG
jgi:alpha/beta superfamily hydrolase